MKIIITIDTDTNEVNVTKEEIEDGKEVRDSDYSVYARWFDAESPAWTKNPGYNLMFIKEQQRYANDMLKVKGHLFLNEVYEMLGMPQTASGQVVGWIYDENDPVDFGLMNERNRNFVNGSDRRVILDFNVHGNILDRI